MNSYNHYAYGAVCQWLFEAVAGFRPDEAAPGFRHIVFEPTIIPELSPVNAHHDSAAGRIEAAWTLDGDRVTYRIVVPPGARGTLVLDPSYKDAVIDGAPVPSARRATEAREPADGGIPRRDIPDRGACSGRNPQVAETRAGDRTANREDNEVAQLRALALILISGAAVPGFAADAVTLTYYIDDNPTNVATAEG